MVGNFMADTLRGKEKNDLPAGVLLGVNIHHAIDNFTDNHPLVLETRKILYPYFSKYAGVVQDVYFDHFLARDWSKYSEVELADFASGVYSVLRKNSILFNQRAERTFYYMSTQNWLLNYSSLKGLDRSLTGLSRRASFQNNMDQSIEPLLNHEEELHQLFDDFFPQLKNHIAEGFGHLLT